MTKKEAQATLKVVKRSPSAKLGTYKIVAVDGEYGILFRPKPQRWWSMTKVYKKDVLR